MRTTRIHWTAYLWPGLPQLWMRGSWVGLAVALGFTALANALLLSFSIYREWFSTENLWMGTTVLAAAWLWAVRQSRVAKRQAALPNETEEAARDGSPAERDQLFREVQTHYLKNDWLVAEKLLLRMLKRDAGDVESRLLLATLWRHQGRRAEALRQLDRLERLEAASQWQQEIAAERLALRDFQLVTENDSEQQPAEKDLKSTQNQEADQPNRRRAA